MIERWQVLKKFRRKLKETLGKLQINLVRFKKYFGLEILEKWRETLE